MPVTDIKTNSGKVATGIIPGPVLLLGAPGVGKGTQAKALMADLGIPQISTGDMIRAILKDPAKAATPVGSQVKALYDRGELISDDMVNDLVAERLAEPDAAKGYILDGFPRTLVQAKWLDDHLEAVQKASTKGFLPVVAVSIRVGYTQLLRRITGRRNCPVCHRIYNIYFQPPQVEGKCDVEGAELVQRADDTEDVFAERMRTYEALTAPVVDHYRALGRFEEVEGEQSVAEVTAGIMAALARLRS
ncbi:MAG: adenylate kinase family protein [Acidobacteriaceae bacterium]